MSTPKIGDTVRILQEWVGSERGDSVGKTGKLVTIDRPLDSLYPYCVELHDGTNQGLWVSKIEVQTLIDPIPGGIKVDVNALWEKVMAALIDDDVQPAVVVSVARIFRENT